MAQADLEYASRNRNTNDVLDDLLNDEDATFDDMLEAMDERRRSPGQQTNIRDGPSSLPQEMLGIDEEVKIKKVRKPVVKLDETRLTSVAGIPKLQKIAKTKVKFRGKGHEFSDVAMLLRTYQLWLHDLYPRAKFHDGLTIIEKLGHTKSLQRLRCGWINESKPDSDGRNHSDEDTISETSRSGSHADAPDPGARQSNVSPGSNIDAGSENGLKQAENNAQTSTADLFGVDAGFPDDDDLDELLAEEASQIKKAQDRTSSNPAVLPSASTTRAEDLEDEFAQDEEMMRELDMWD